eukprot:Nitzschia sp. Nitz4//scaffold125_size66327//33984//34844//NITZ4_006132-RA/size66327-processed-gene-0.28-mRNA-1//-1//CDS//3329534616//2539//frame0
MSASANRRTNPALWTPLLPQESPPIHDHINTNNLYNRQEVLHGVLCRMYIAAHIMRLGEETRFAALMFMQRYFHVVRRILYSPDLPDLKWVAAVCLFLATKTEEQSRRLRDVINMVSMVLDTDYRNLSPSEKPNIQLEYKPPSLNDKYWESKKTIVETEQHLLRFLGFDVDVPRPHRVVTLLLAHVEEDEARNGMKVHCFRVLNDALFDSEALQFGALVLACSSIEIARDACDASSSAFPMQWWTQYHVVKEELVQAMARLQMAARKLEGDEVNDKTGNLRRLYDY